MTRQLLAWLLLLPLLATPAAAQERVELRDAAELDALVGEQWYGVYFQGTKSGWSRTRLARGGTPEAPTFVLQSEFKARVLAMGKETGFELFEEQVYDARPPFALLSGVSRMVQDEQRAERRIERREGGWRVSLRAGEAEPHGIDLPPFTYGLADELATCLWIRRHPAAGARMEHASLQVDEAEVIRETVTVLEVEERRGDGVPVKVWRIKWSSEREGEQGEQLVDAAGTLLRADLMGVCEMRLEPEEVAKQTGVGGDLFLQGLVPLDRPLGETAKLVRLRVRLEGEARGEVPGGPWQEVGEEDGMPVLTVDVRQGPRVEAAGEDVARALRATPETPADHPAVQALARQAVGDARTPAEKVARLVHFVAGYVEDAYGADSLTVLQVIEKKRGDCSEHAALFTALARAAGIPTRTVSGLAYMDDEAKAFGGHAWNEVALDGVWVPVDPTFDEERIDASHVRLGHEGGPDASLRVHGKLRFVLLDARREE